MAETKKKLPTMARLGVIFLICRRHTENGVRKYKVTLNQLYLLRQLARKEFLYPADIAEMLFCDRPTATVIINNLIRYGFVVKEKDEENGKRLKVMITKEGRDKVHLIEEDNKQNEKSFDPLDCFNEEEKETLDRLLIKLHNYVKQIEK